MQQCLSPSRWNTGVRRSALHLLDQLEQLLMAVKVLASHGHMELAEALWNTTIGPERRVLLPGEKN